MRGRPLEITLKIGYGNHRDIILNLDFEQTAFLEGASPRELPRWRACATRTIGPGELAAYNYKQALSRQHPLGLRIIPGGRT